MLHLIVPCTASKRGKPRLQLRDIAPGPTRARLAAWSRFYSRPSGREPGERWWTPEQLYRGPSWSVTQRIRAALRARGAEHQCFVASAGWGLIESTRPSLLPYSATFAASADSVGSPEACREWWWLLGECWSPAVCWSIRLLSAVELGEPMLVVLSASYMNACRDDLVAALEWRAPGELLLVTSEHADVPEALEPWTARTSKSMMRGLGANCVTLNHAAALAIVQRIDLDHLDVDSARAVLAPYRSRQQTLFAA